MIGSVKDIILLEYFGPVAIDFFGQTRVLDTLMLHQRFHLHMQTGHITHQ